MAFNVGIMLSLLKTFDAVMGFNDFMNYQIMSFYRVHITDCDCLFVGYCSKASAQYD